MRLVYKPQAIKQLKRLPLKEKKKIVRKLEILVNDPHAGKSLKGELKGLYSIRAWPYRIVYSANKSTLTIFSIAHRQSIYR